MRKRLILTEDFYVNDPETGDSYIFEPGDEIEIETDTEPMLDPEESDMVYAPVEGVTTSADDNGEMDIPVPDVPSLQQDYQVDSFENDPSDVSGIDLGIVPEEDEILISGVYESNYGHIYRIKTKSEIDDYIRNGYSTFRSEFDENPDLKNYNLFLIEPESLRLIGLNRRNFSDYIADYPTDYDRNKSQYYHQYLV